MGGGSEYTHSKPVMMAPTSFGTTEPRDLRERFNDLINVKDFGAKGDGVTDDSAAIVSALSNGSIFFPDGNYLIQNISNQSPLYSAFDNAKVYGKVEVHIPSGHYVQTSPWTFSAIGGENISILGADPITVSATSASVSGSSNNWSVVFTCAGTSGVSVGDYALLCDTTQGTGAHEALRGIWKITAVSSNQITVLNTSYCSSFPEFTLTSCIIKVLTTVVKFNDCDGIVVKDGAVGKINNIAIVGNASEYWSSSDVSGTEKGTHGVHVGNATIAQGDGSGGNPEGLSNSTIHLGPYFGVSDFDQQGIVASSGCSIFARGVASCSNRRRGFYAETCASIQCKNSIGSGNYLDGYIGDFGGSIICNLSTACGNGSNGFHSLNGGYVGTSRSVAKANNGNGYNVVGSGEIYCNDSISSHNGIDGFHGEFGGVLLANSTTAENNANDGFEAISNACIRSNGAISSNNGRYGFRASSGGTITNNSTFTGTGNASGLVSCLWGYLQDISQKYPINQIVNFSNDMTVSGKLSTAEIESTGNISTSQNMSASGTLSVAGELTSSGRLTNTGNDFRVQRNASSYLRMALSSIGDAYFTLGSYSWRLRNDGTFCPGDTSGTQSIGEGEHSLKNVISDYIGTSGAPVLTVYATNLGSSSVPASNVHTGTIYATSVGSFANPVDTVYATTGPWSGSDRRIKDSIEEINPSVLDAWEKIRFKVFQFKSAIDKKGRENARLHFGVVAQDVDKVFSSSGLNASRYGLFWHDVWDDQFEEVEVIDSEAVYDADGNEIEPKKIHFESKKVLDAGDLYGIRYEEALILESAYQRNRAEKAEERISSLENRVAQLEQIIINLTK